MLLGRSWLFHIYSMESKNSIQLRALFRVPITFNQHYIAMKKARLLTWAHIHKRTFMPKDSDRPDLVYFCWNNKKLRRLGWNFCSNLSIFKNCRFEYGGGKRQLWLAANGCEQARKQLVSNCQFSELTGDAVYMYSSSPALLSNLTFTNIDGLCMKMSASVYHELTFTLHWQTPKALK